MKIINLTFIISILCSTFLLSQDNIILKSGEELEVKITEVSEHVIKYKKLDFLEGPNFQINTKDIFIIKYSNGDKQVFNVLDGDDLGERKYLNTRIKNRDFGLILGVNFPVINGKDREVFNNNLEYAAGDVFYPIYIGFKLGLSVLENRITKTNKDYNLGSDIYFETKGFEIEDVDNHANWMKDDLGYLTLTSFVQLFPETNSGNKILSICYY